MSKDSTVADSIAKKIGTLNSEVSNRKKSPRRRDVKAAVEPILAEQLGENLKAEEAAAIRDSVKTVGGWSEVKGQGKNFFSGALHSTVTGLIDDLKIVGVYVIPMGEVESFFKEAAGGSTASYVADVLDRKLHLDNTKNTEIKKFIGDLVESFAAQMPGTTQTEGDHPLRGRFALLPVRDQVVTSEYIRDLMEREGV